MSLGKEFSKVIEKNLVRLNLGFAGKGAIFMSRHFKKS